MDAKIRWLALAKAMKFCGSESFILLRSKPVFQYPLEARASSFGNVKEEVRQLTCLRRIERPTMVTPARRWGNYYS